MPSWRERTCRPPDTAFSQGRGIVEVFAMAKAHEHHLQLRLADLPQAPERIESAELGRPKSLLGVQCDVIDPAHTALGTGQEKSMAVIPQRLPVRLFATQYFGRRAPIEATV